MKLKSWNSAFSRKCLEDPPPYDGTTPWADQKIISSDAIDRVAGGPPIIAGKRRNYWRTWTEADTSSPNINPGLFGVLPYEAQIQDNSRCCIACRFRRPWDRIKHRVHHKRIVEPSACPCQVPAPVNNGSLYAGDMEQVIHPDRDWTKHWAWAINMVVPSDPKQRNSGRFCYIRILAKDLSAQLRDGEISWRQRNWKSEYDQYVSVNEVSHRESYNARRLAFSTPETLEKRPLNSRSWVAEVMVTHDSKEWLKNHDFREALSPKNIAIAEVDQRTGPGRCKKVVMYRDGVLYGNDMTGQKVEAWKDEFTASLGAFLEPMLWSGE